jgi:hypothetical protein
MPAHLEFANRMHAASECLRNSNVEIEMEMEPLQAYLILDEFILAGELQESSKQVILDRIGQLEGLDPSGHGLL